MPPTHTDRDALLQHLDTLLDPEGMEDHGPNGLQVEGRGSIRTVAAGVTASRRVIQEAVRREADALLVHHGLFWQHMGPPRLKGWLGERVRLLMESRMNLIAYHLPLDLHPQMGNNARLLDQMGMKTIGRFGDRDLGFIGEHKHGVSVQQMVADLQKQLDARVIAVGDGPEKIHRVGVVTGAGQRFLEDAVEAGCDLFITGEASEFVTHVAREAGIHYAWAGHHATERFGVQAVCEHLEKKYKMDTFFIDEENPV